ncbi:MAG: carbohydrate ABC transporter permease [Solirubrobacterales bacterium]
MASVKRLASRVPYRWALLAPLLVLLAVFVAYPLGYSFYLSLTDYSLLQQGGDFVGTDQYARVLASGDFWDSMQITAVYVLIAVTLELVLGLSLALALQRQRWARNITRAMLFTPMFVAPVAVGLTFRYMLNQQLGVIPSLLEKVGVHIDFFGPELALPTMALIDTWQWTPFMVLLFLSALEARPKAPLEAARVDGASAWLTFRALTLRMIAPVIAVAVIVRVLEASKLFEYVFVITSGGPGGATNSAQFLMYQTGIRFFRLGEAAAMAFVLLALLVIPIVLFFRAMRREIAGAS